MIVADSSAWLEYFGEGPLASVFAPILEDLQNLIVPSITIYEVHKRMQIQLGPDAAMTAVSMMMQGRIILLDGSLALDASRLSVVHKLPMADSIIYATAVLYNATIWTTDKHFKDLPNVEYREKK